MADGTVILGVTAVLTSGVFGPLVLHHAQKDRDTLGARRAVLDSAVGALAVARAQEAWLEAAVLRDDQPATDEVNRRMEELLRQTHVAEAHALKLELRFGKSELSDACTAAAGAINEQASTVSLHWYGSLPRGAVEAAIEQAEAIYLDNYARFVNAGVKWHEDVSGAFTRSQ
jgi:hypothetical protein